MGKFTLQELEEALSIYTEAHRKSSQTGDWSIWASVFTDDATYIEHYYGEFSGREEIEKWIIGCMAPFPHMTFEHEWAVIDEENDAIVCCVRNALKHPTDPNKEFWFPNWTRLVYAGDGKFSLEEDIYNPARDAERVVREWIKAGGRIEGESTVQPIYRYVQPK